ncbi:thioester reductase-like protein [Nocardiopsis sp. Huas11]|uniref:thioester reductase domain-containing protein n=1 Tax=Nocardiopsis sp. Huas11 TaxID=2183912 RepID=UPI000EB4D162|nr:thioester reductase domain-containing protein [Nocardiopsis sp. Huas11]RKS10373.1 thioester reductase-like protein [Nocardiopsis sp. Huas11]
MNPTQTDDNDRSDVLRRALIEVRTAREEAAESRRRHSEPVAVVGMGCRFPGGASGVDAFWDLLVEGRSGVVEVPPDRWDLADFHDDDPDARGRMYTRHGGFVDGIRDFDAGLFGIPPREAVGIDPQHRFVLEVAWEALENAGIAPDSLKGSRTGVFVGMGGSDYERLTLSTGDVTDVDGYAATGGALNMAANRLSYALGLEGPSLVVDTACSSSLVALHLACQSLRAGECDTAIVAGVNSLLSPSTSVALSKAGMLSPEGRCKTFDAAADGYVRGEGCGVVVLRRASSVEGTHLRARALVKGSATNQDGHSSGLTVPRASAQSEVVRRALAAADVRPADVGYVEAHGTGTPLGDPIEVRALASVLGEGRDASDPVVLGSVKTNIGHLEAAAGIAGLIKTVLAVEHGHLPPHLNLTDPNPAVDWAALPVVVGTRSAPWTAERRVAGVSSFGFGGTNAHVVVESAPAGPEAPGGATQPPDTVAVKVSGRGEAAVRQSAAALAARVRAEDPADAHALAWSAGVGRADLTDRAVVVAASAGELAAGLDAVARGDSDPAVVRGRRGPGGAPRVAFVVPAAGPRLAGALAGVYGRVPAVTETVDALTEVWGAVTEPPLAALLDGADAEAALSEPAAARAAAFTAAVALGRWWESVGVRPDLVVGHGGSGYAAGVLAGALGLRDGALLTRSGAGPDEAALGGTEFTAPTADLVTETDAADTGLDPSSTAYWHHRADASMPVTEVVHAAADRGVDVVVELGHGGLLPHFLTAAPEEEPVCVPSVQTERGVRHGLVRAAARVWAAGADLDWARLNGPAPADPPVLPTYPFQRRTFWPASADPRRSLTRAADAGGPAAPGRPLLRVLRTADGRTVGEAEVSLSRVPFLAEHRVHGLLVVPGVLFLNLVLECADALFDGTPRAQDLAVSRSLVLGDDDTATVQVVLDPVEDGRARARVFSQDADGRWRSHFETVVHGDQDPTPPDGAVDEAGIAAGADAATEPVTGDFYTRAWHPEFRLGPSFRLVRAARRGERSAVGTLVQPAPDAAGVRAGVRPELLLLDACIQLVSVVALAERGFDDQPVHLGTGYERIWVGPTGDHEELECVTVLRGGDDGRIVGDLRLYGDDGSLVAEVWGAGFSPVTERTLERLAAERRAGVEAGPRRPGVPSPEALRAASGPERERLVLAHVTGVLAAILGADVSEVELDALLVDVADSLMIAELRTAVIEDLGVTLPMDVFFDDRTPASLARLVSAEIAVAAEAEAERRAEPKAATVRRTRGLSVERMTELAGLDTDIRADGAPEPVGVAPTATLLTGATGFVGAFLLAELLNRRDGDVHCLVRADDTAHASRRIEDNLRRYGIDAGARLSRVVPVVGDLAEPLLGLPEAEFTALHGRVGDIVHCGGMVKWTYPYSGLEGPNVTGTREVLRLATAGAPRPVHFISTVGVFSSEEYTADTVDETADLHESGPLVVGYAQTKWVSERMVRTAAERGLPVTVHRINTGGHSVTGAFNRLDHLSLILKGCTESGLAPHTLALMPVQPAPIDYVASAVVELAGRPENHGGTFHLANHRSMSWKEFFDSVEEFGYPLERMPLDDWRARVTGRDAGTMALLGLAPFLQDSMDHARVPFFESELTRKALSGTGVSCPPLDTGLVHTFLRAFVDAGFIHPPQK